MISDFDRLSVDVRPKSIKMYAFLYDNKEALNSMATSIFSADENSHDSMRTQEKLVAPLNSHQLSTTFVLI